MCDWLSAVEAEHEDCDAKGGSVLTANKVSDNYRSRIDDQKEKLDKLKGHSEQLQQLAGVSELPELEESIRGIEQRITDVGQKNDKLGKELQQLNGESVFTLPFPDGLPLVKLYCRKEITTMAA